MKYVLQWNRDELREVFTSVVVRRQRRGCTLSPADEWGLSGVALIASKNSILREKSNFTREPQLS